MTASPEGRRRRRWAADNPGNQAIRTELEAAALAAAAPALRGPGPVLDAGCGTGWWLNALLTHGVVPGRLHGADRDSGRVAAAAERAPGAEVIEADLRALPHADGTFAAAFLLTVLSSTGGREAARAAASEVWRVLAPGGLLVVWEPRLPNPGNRATTLIRPRDLAPVAGRPAHLSTLTVVPAVARRLGARTDAWYPRLARLAALRTHWLGVWER